MSLLLKDRDRCCAGKRMTDWKAGRLDFLHFPLDVLLSQVKKHRHGWAQSSFAVIPAAAEGSRAVRRDFFCLLYGEVGPFRVNALA